MLIAGTIETVCVSARNVPTTVLVAGIIETVLVIPAEIGLYYGSRNNRNRLSCSGTDGPIGARVQF